MRRKSYIDEDEFYNQNNEPVTQQDESTEQNDESGFVLGKIFGLAGIAITGLFTLINIASEIDNKRTDSKSNDFFRELNNDIDHIKNKW